MYQFSLYPHHFNPLHSSVASFQISNGGIMKIGTWIRLVIIQGHNLSTEWASGTHILQGSNLEIDLSVTKSIL